MTDWDPETYLRFKDERTRPAIDLAAHVPVAAPATVLDVGCGPGNSTAILRRRWPQAEVTGLDSSPAMIRQAAADFPAGSWVLADIATYRPGRRFDVVFSNAALQWIPDHETLVPALLDLVGAGGALAVQVPGNHGSPLHQALVRVAQAPPWAEHTAACVGLINDRDIAYYHDLLAGRGVRLDLWETTYVHAMRDHRALVEWYRSTGMRPYLSRLPDDVARQRFLDEVLEACRPGYPVQRDGTVLFPFRRLFFVAAR